MWLVNTHWPQCKGAVKTHIGLSVIYINGSPFIVVIHDVLMWGEDMKYVRSAILLALQVYSLE